MLKMPSSTVKPPRSMKNLELARGLAAAANPHQGPQLNVRPSQACGHQVMRFMNG